jgi:thiol:disulfide interchange protein DsbD
MSRHARILVGAIAFVILVCGVPQVRFLNLGLRTTAADEVPITWTVKSVSRKAVTRGMSVTVRLGATIQSGWHLYGLDEPEGGPTATQISLADDHGYELGSIGSAKPIELMDPNFGMRVGFYVEKTEFQLPIKILKDAPTGAQSLTVKVRYQTCNDKLCLPPRIEKLPVQLDIK